MFLCENPDVPYDERYQKALCDPDAGVMLSTLPIYLKLTKVCPIFLYASINDMLTRTGSQAAVRQPYQCCYVIVWRVFFATLNIKVFG